jgi:hypothetical protein
LPVRHLLPTRRLLATLLALALLATLQATLAGPVAASTTRLARCDGANLRAHANTDAKTKMRMPKGTKVTVSGTVTGGHWKTHCGGGTHSGNTWFKVTSVNGKSIQKRFGVPFLYGATRLYKPKPTSGSGGSGGSGGGSGGSGGSASSDCDRRASVDKSGDTDVTDELQRFIDNSPNGSVVCLASDGRYKVNGTLRIRDRGNIVFDGNGSTIVQTNRGTARILLIDGSSHDITVRDLTIKGANPSPGTWNSSYEHNHGIEVGGAVDLTMGNVRIVNVGGDGLYLSAGHVGSKVRWASNIRFHHGTIDGTGRSGISITDGAQHVVIEENTMRHIAFYTLNLEANGHVWDGVAAGARDVRFSDNTLGSQPYGTGVGNQPVGHVFVATGSSGGGPVDDIKIARNTISGRPFDIGVYDNGGLRRNIRVTDNKSDTSASGAPMVFNGVDTLVVTGNRQPLDGSQLVAASGCTDVTISGNVTP